MDLKDKGETDKFAHGLVTYEIDPTLESQGDLPERRKKNYAIYRNEPGCSGQQNIAPNYKPFHVPFTQPRIDIIAGDLYQRFTGVDPMVQFVPTGFSTVDDGNAMERLAQTVFERGYMDTQFPLGVQTAAVCGVTVFRFFPDKNKGMCLEALHPDDVVVYPSTVSCVRDAMTVGHKFYLSVDDIREKEESGEYLPGCSEGLTGVTLTNEDIAGSPIIARSQPEASVVLSKDKPVECWELLTRRDIGEDDDEGAEPGEALYRVVITRAVPRLLCIERLDYSRPWYFEGRLHVEWGGFYPESSIAQNLQGMQHLYTDLHNALVAGSFSAMSPRVILSGGVMGEKVFTLGFGDVYQSTGQIQVSVIPSSFNPGVLPQMIQEVDAKGDAIARVSRIAQNRQLKGRTTATEADMLQSQGDDAQMQYAAHFSRPVAEMAQFVQECARIHPAYMAEHYPEAPVTPEQANGTYSVEVTGRVQGNLPQAQLEKLQTAFAAVSAVNAQRLQTGLPPVYDDVELTDQILETMQLPFSTEKLKLQQGQGQGQGQDGNGTMGQQPPGMGADMGEPGMGPGNALPFYPQGQGGGGGPFG